ILFPRPRIARPRRPAGEDPGDPGTPAEGDPPMRRVSRSKVEKLAREASATRRRAVCPACGKIGRPVFRTTRYTDPLTGTEYLEPAIPEKCRTCRRGGNVVIINNCAGAIFKAPGAPKETASWEGVQP